METKSYRDTTHKLVHGHEGWMEDFISHYHACDPIMAMLKWGHNCQTDGLPKMEQMTYTVCAPDGSINDVKCELGDEDCLDLTADTLEEGYYTFIATYNNCWAKYGEADEDYKFGDRKEYPDAIEVRNYLQYATLTVPVGHFHAHELDPIPSMKLSILPAKGSDFQETHAISFLAVFDGKPLVNHKALAVQILDDGSTIETELMSDEDGIVRFLPEIKGTYSMVLRYSDEISDPDGRYEGTNYTATHGFRVSEHSHDHDHGHHGHEEPHTHDHHELDELMEEHQHDHEHCHDYCHDHHHDHDHDHDHNHEHHHHHH